MEKYFVHLEEALALKKLGFNENCLARFDGGGFRLLPVYGPLKNSEIKEPWFCVSPLYSQAFEFFREKDLMVNFAFHTDYLLNSDKNVYEITIEDIKADKLFLMTPLNGFKTYEEAEVESLKQLIKIANGRI